MNKTLENLGLVLALANDGIIGINNDLPWKFGTQKADMKRFKELTTGNIVIMGRNTFESMGSKPLPNRLNIVLTSQELISEKENLCFTNPIDLDGFITELCNINPDKQVFVIGGANIIKQTRHLISKMFLTSVYKDVDVSFETDVVSLEMEYLTEDFKMVFFQMNPSDIENGNHYGYGFSTYESLSYNRNKALEITGQLING